MPHKILISGSLAYDRIMDFPGRFRDHIMPEKVHALSVSFTVRKMQTRMGGNAGNIAYTLKLLDDDPVILACAGNDFGLYRRWLQKYNINARSIEIDRARNTAVAHITTDRDDNQITAFAPGATERVYRLTAAEMKSYRAASLALIGPSHTKDVMRKSKTFARAKIPYFADPGQIIPILSRNELLTLIRRATALFGNDYEIELIQKKTRKTKKQLINMLKFLVATRGAKGSYIYTSNRVIKIPAIKSSKIVDPTGAGDAYRAGFMHGYVRGAPLETCGRIASLVARLPIAHYGTQEHSLSLRDRRRVRALLAAVPHKKG